MRRAVDQRMTADEFIEWAMTQPNRYELVDGEVCAMAPERAAHVIVKNRVWQSLDRAIADVGMACEAYGDGMTVLVDERTAYEPDALLRCGDPLDRAAINVADPVVVVEVLSPSTQAVDLAGKLEGYFRLASVRHYLICMTAK